MGLDSFTSDDNEVESDTTPTGGGSKHRVPDVGPRFAHHGFGPASEVASRSIKYQIKSFAANWNTQFSTLRFEHGELVMYSAGINTRHDGKTVMVFTTIQEITADEPPEEEQPIWVVPWDLNKQDNLESGTYIEFQSEWNEQLYEVIGRYLEQLEDY